MFIPLFVQLGTVKSVVRPWMLDRLYGEYSSSRLRYMWRRKSTWLSQTDKWRNVSSATVVILNDWHSWFFINYYNASFWNFYQTIINASEFSEMKFLRWHCLKNVEPLEKKKSIKEGKTRGRMKKSERIVDSRYSWWSGPQMGRSDDPLWSTHAL